QGFAWDVEVVAVARRRGIAVEEMGVRWSHDAETRVHPLRDGAAMVRAVPRIWRNLQSVPRCGDAGEGLPAASRDPSSSLRPGS
ncbi:MAG: hypothetical protein ACR2K0_02290, partial [Acidimicrobiales bacterium]